MARLALAFPIALTGAALVAAVPASAQQGGPSSAPAGPGTGNGDIAASAGRDSITLGIGAAYVPDYDGSNDYRVVPAPVAIGSWKRHNFSLVGNRASFNLIPQRSGPTWNFEVGPIGVINFNRTSNSNIDNPQVRALPERNTAFELGGYVGVNKTGVITSPYDRISLSLSSRWDVSGNNKSYVINPSLTYLTPLSLKAAVGLLASGSYVGGKYNRYYFGVTPAESVRSGLPVFVPTSSWNSFTLGGFATYSLTGNLLHGFKVVAGGTYSREEGEAARSPLVRVGSPNQWIGAVGLAYTF